MGRVDSKLFRPCASTDTESPALSTFRVSPFRHLSTPPVISSRRYLNTLQHPDNAPNAFLFRRRQQRTENGVGDRRGRSIVARCYPAASDSICRRDLAKWEREEDAGKSVTEMVVSCADRWSMKPPITPTPWSPRVVRAISRLAALVLNCQSDPSETMRHRGIGISIERHKAAGRKAWRI